MNRPESWVNSDNAALLTDLYQLTMVQAYWQTGMQGEAVFDLLFRRLPRNRNYVITAGLDTVLTFLENFRFTPDAIGYLATLGKFTQDFLNWLAGLRFTGDVYAMREGTPVFPGEPMLEVVAPIPQAQLVETFVMNQMHVQSVLATKAARVVQAAAGRPVVDFGLRRTHGAEAGLRLARACYIAGVSATSNVLAGRFFGIPLAGTVAHSFIQACDDELEAFRRFTDVYPETTLLLDTYDTLDGVDRLLQLARELGGDFHVRAVRLDSGDLLSLSREVRRRLDHAGLKNVQIFASNQLDENKIARLVAAKAPIDAFGVGSAMGVSPDSPVLDLAYKLVAYEGMGRIKTSPGKRLLPGRKQVFRQGDRGHAKGDVLAAADEIHPGRALLQKVVEAGQRLPAAELTLTRIRDDCRDGLAELPDAVRSLTRARHAYPVSVSPRLLKLQRELAQRFAGA